MDKTMKIITWILAIIGFASIIKYINDHKKDCKLCGWHKIKVEDKRSTGKSASNQTEDEEIKPGSRYGSNPRHY